MSFKSQISWGWGGKGFLPNLWVKYRLTSEDYNKIWNDQEGKCAGCRDVFAHPFWKRAEMGIRPEVDHDHTTSGDDVKVRGLLCGACNALLGKIKDNHEIITNLIAYLKRAGQTLV
jgi:hypothetical protein